MPSPFPGMDPYIEASGRWAGFHRAFVAECARQLNQILPRDYVARLEVRPQTDALPQEIDWLDKPTEAFIHLQRFPEEQVVTGVEMLSQSNKAGKGRAAYLARRFDYRQASMNLVELDFLLAGERVLAGRPLPQHHYCAFLTRASRAELCEFYPWSVRDELQSIPVPLRTGEEDVPLELKAAFDRTYDGGRFHMLIDYSAHLPAELVAPDREWAIRRAATR